MVLRSMYRGLALLVLSIFVFAYSLQAQYSHVTTTFAQTSSLSMIREHSPTKALLFSAVCPGLGQAYNKQYWKIPVIYAGFAGFTYGAVYMNSFYQEFKGAYNDYRNPYLSQGLQPKRDTLLTVLGDEYSPEYVQLNRDNFRRYRDMCLIGVGTWYILNILEAYVYAHMFDFDTSDNLSLRIEPYFYTSYKQTPGIRFTLTF